MLKYQILVPSTRVLGYKSRNLCPSNSGTRGETILEDPPPGSQLSQYRLIFLPSPILHLIPSEITFLAFIILCHAYDPDEVVASRTEPFGKYLALKTRKKREF